MRYLAIDPSMNRIGWACYDTKAGDFNQLASWYFGTCCPPRQGGKEGTLTSVKFYFSRAIADHLICEMPTFFDSEVGRVAAKQGYTLDLALVIGTIYGCIPGAELFLYTPQQWKGSTPKRITQVRFKKAFPDSNHWIPVHDTIDAIMLLRYHVLNRKLTVC